MTNRHKLPSLSSTFDKDFEDTKRDIEQHTQLIHFGKEGILTDEVLMAHGISVDSVDSVPHKIGPALNIPEFNLSLDKQDVADETETETTLLPSSVNVADNVTYVTEDVSAADLLDESKGLNDNLNTVKNTLISRKTATIATMTTSVIVCIISIFTSRTSYQVMITSQLLAVIAMISASKEDDAKLSKSSRRLLIAVITVSVMIFITTLSIVFMTHSTR